MIEIIRTPAQAEAWMDGHFPDKHQWVCCPYTTITPYSGRLWIAQYMHNITEDPAGKQHYFREALRMRKVLLLGVTYRVNMQDGTGRSYPVIPGIPLNHEWQYKRSDAR